MKIKRKCEHCGIIFKIKYIRNETIIQRCAIDRTFCSNCAKYFRKLYEDTMKM